MMHPMVVPIHNMLYSTGVYILSLVYIIMKACVCLEYNIVISCMRIHALQINLTLLGLFLVYSGY